MDVAPWRGVDAGVAQRLGQRLVGVLQVDVLADHGDVDLVLRVARARATSLRPRRQVGGLAPGLQLVADDLVQPLLVQHQRDLVDDVDVPGRDHRRLLHVGEQRDLAALVLRQRTLGAAQQRVGLDADAAQLLHGVLGRLGLDLARGGDVGHQRQVDVAALLRPARGPSGGWPRGTAATRCRPPCRRSRRCHLGVAGAALDAGLDLVGDVRDDLHGAAEVVAAALLVDHRS